MVEFEGKSNPDGELEEELRATLLPIAPPSGFVNRVVARAQESPRAGAMPFPVRRHGFLPAIRWSIAAVLLLAVSFGGFIEHQRQRRIAGEHARQQVLLALRITSVTLQAVRSHLDRNGTN